MRTERRAGIAHISFPKEQYPDALAPRGPCAFREQRSRGDANKVAALGRGHPFSLLPGAGNWQNPSASAGYSQPLNPPAYAEGVQPGARAKNWSGGVSSPPSPMPFTLLVPRPPHPPWQLGHLLPRAPACSSFPPHFSSWFPKNQILLSRLPYELPGLWGALGGLNQLTKGTRREVIPDPPP